MSKIIKSNNHVTKKRRDRDSSMSVVLSKLPVEIISSYPHKSLYRCFSTYLRKNPSIIFLEVQESKFIYNAWRIDEAQRRKMLRNQKRNFSSPKRERKYTYNNLYEDFEYCYDDDKDNQSDDYHESQINKVNEQLLNVNRKINEIIDEPIDEPIDKTIDEPIDKTIDEPIDEEKFKKKIREQIEEITNDISVYLDSEYEVHHFIPDYIPL